MQANRLEDLTDRPTFAQLQPVSHRPAGRAKGFTDAEIRRALERLDLDAREHMLLELLIGLSLLCGYAWMGQEKLAARVRCSVRTLYETTGRLRERGLLETTLLRDGLRYFPQWEAIGLEGPESERERAGQRSAKPAAPDRQNLRMPLLSNEEINKREAAAERARARTHATRAEAVASPAAALKAVLPEEPSAASAAFAEHAPQSAPQRPQPAESGRKAPGAPLVSSSASAPSGALLGARAARAKQVARPELARGVGVALLSALVAMPRAQPDADDEADELAEAQDLALSAARTLGLPTPPADLVLAPIVPHGRVPAPAAVLVAPPDRLAQVLEKFGPEAHADVLDVLRRDPAARANPTAAFDALDRLLEMHPSEFRKGAGACYRDYVRRAAEGTLRLAKTHPRGGTHLQRLRKQLDHANQLQTGEAAQVLDELHRYGQHVAEQVSALRQLEPSPRFEVSAAPERQAPRLPPPPRLPLRPTNDRTHARFAQLATTAAEEPPTCPATPASLRLIASTSSS